MRHSLETDYLVVGAGAMGLAFADEIIHGSKSARVVLVDRRAKAGGHWNDAYPFVKLHQPALYYGVGSERLGSGVGTDLVSRAEILSYDERVIKKLTATGRCTFLSLCDYTLDGRIVSTVAPEIEYDVRVNRKIVDATYMNVTVPSTTPPKYEVASDVALIPINGLAALKKPWDRYIVVGAGKTGMDAALFLLSRNVDPNRIAWIMPNDAWLLNRASTMPGSIADNSNAQLRVFGNSKSMDELLQGLETEGGILRFDSSRWPTRFRCATVTNDELDALRRIKDVVRMGRVVRIDASSIELTRGRREVDPKTLFVDCTADGLARRPAVPIFGADRITLQPVVMCQQVFSAAAIAAIETRVSDDQEKDDICEPIPHPMVPPDLAAGLMKTIDNVTRMGRKMPFWMIRTRLLPARHMQFIEAIRAGYGAIRHRIRDPEGLEAMIQTWTREWVQTRPDPADPGACQSVAVRSHRSPRANDIS